MILVFGETYDSLLGLRALLGETVASPSMANNMPAFEGEAFGEKILGITCGSSNYLSLLVAEKAILSYKPDLVVSLGEASSLSPRLKLGDIVVGNRLYFRGVDFTEQGLPYGAIPGYAAYFFSDIDAARNAESIGTKMPSLRVLRGDILSGEKKIVEQEEFASQLLAHYASNSHMLAYDCNSAGIALACKEENVPYLPLRSITYLPLEGDEGALRERRMSLQANQDSARLLLAFLKERRGA